MCGSNIFAQTIKQGDMIMEELHQKIRARLEELRVHLQADGGDLEVVAIEGKTVKLSLRGSCGSCPYATMTIKDGLERILKEELDSDIVIERV
jgi:Fe-S cluster biogenesis protein NfuA